MDAFPTGSTVAVDRLNPGSKEPWMAAASSASTRYQMVWWAQAPPAPFQGDAFCILVEEDIQPPFAEGASLRSMNLSDHEKHIVAPFGLLLGTSTAGLTKNLSPKPDAWSHRGAIVVTISCDAGRTLCRASHRQAVAGSYLVCQTIVSTMTLG